MEVDRKAASSRPNRPMMHSGGDERDRPFSFLTHPSLAISSSSTVTGGGGGGGSSSGGGSSGGGGGGGGGATPVSVSASVSLPVPSSATRADLHGHGHMLARGHGHGHGHGHGDHEIYPGSPILPSSKEYLPPGSGFGGMRVVRGDETSSLDYLHAGSFLDTKRDRDEEDDPALDYADLSRGEESASRKKKQRKIRDIRRGCTCKNRCYDTILTEEVCRRIRDEFDSMSHDEQQLLLIKLISRKELGTDGISSSSMIQHHDQKKSPSGSMMDDMVVGDVDVKELDESSDRHGHHLHPSLPHSHTMHHPHSMHHLQHHQHRDTIGVFGVETHAVSPHHDSASKRPRGKHVFDSEYHVIIDGRKHKVCRQAFLNVFGVGSSRLSKLARDYAQNTPFVTDRRGKHGNRPMRIPDELRDQVADHIRNFPRDTFTPVSKMYQNYAEMFEKEWLQQQTEIKRRKEMGDESIDEREAIKPRISLHFYRDMFSSQFKDGYWPSEVAKAPRPSSIGITSPGLSNGVGGVGGGGSVGGSVSDVVTGGSVVGGPMSVVVAGRGGSMSASSSVASSGMGGVGGGVDVGGSGMPSSTLLHHSHLPHHHRHHVPRVSASSQGVSSGHLSHSVMGSSSSIPSHSSSMGIPPPLDSVPTSMMMDSVTSGYSASASSSQIVETITPVPPPELPELPPDGFTFSRSRMSQPGSSMHHHHHHHMHTHPHMGAVRTMPRHGGYHHQVSSSGSFPSSDGHHR